VDVYGIRRGHRRSRNGARSLLTNRDLGSGVKSAHEVNGPTQIVVKEQEPAAIYSLERHHHDSSRYVDLQFTHLDVSRLSAVQHMCEITAFRHVADHLAL